MPRPRIHTPVGTIARISADSAHPPLFGVPSTTEWLAARHTRRPGLRQRCVSAIARACRVASRTRGA